MIGLCWQGERIYNFAGYFNFAIAIGLKDSDPDGLFNVNAVSLPLPANFHPKQ